jgi:cell shape-determining protein MreC
MNNELVKQMTEVLMTNTADIVKAFGEQGINTVDAMEANQELATAKQEIILKNAEYGALKNEGQRSAFLADLLEPMYSKTRELEASRVVITTCINVADANIRMARVILETAGKIPA